MKCKNFSSIRRLLSVTSYVLKFCNSLLSKVWHVDISSCVDETEVLWIGASQRSLRGSNNFLHLERQFGFFQDDDMLW